MPTLNIELTPELESYVQSKVDGGRYKDAGELVREALQFQKEDDARMEALERAIDEGEASGIYEGDPFQDILDEMDSGAIDHPERLAS